VAGCAPTWTSSFEVGDGNRPEQDAHAGNQSGGNYWHQFQQQRTIFLYLLVKGLESPLDVLFLGHAPVRAIR
jgi:hypothetical protein